MAGNEPGDPHGPPDGTVLRPRPGAGRRPAPGGGSAAGTGPAASFPAGPGSTSGSGAGTAAGSGSAAFEPGAARSRAFEPPGLPDHATPALADFFIAGRNPILQAAAPLLTLAARLQTTARQADVGALRREATHAVRVFEDRLKSVGVLNEDALVARYVVCTFVDSAVLNTPWGAQSDWSAQSLLATFHREVGGGEKFFQILDRLRTDPGRYIDLIELLYVCLALGFEGKYRIEERGREKLADLQHELFRLIRERRQLRDEELSPHWRGVQETRNPLLRFVPWWIAAAAGLALLVIGFVWFHAQLASQAGPIKAALAQPAAKLEYAAAAAPRANRLKVLLAPEEQAGRLTVEELGDKTVITLVAQDLFRSGSARVNPRYYPTLREVAIALDAVPGRVVIVGHTDDQPVRSLQYADNFELSRERAIAVARLLKPALDDFGRLEWSGVGSSQPRYRPQSMSENRARNRRVEVIHLGTGSAMNTGGAR